jgi:transcriptional regulator with XRE-family HTH domain
VVLSADPCRSASPPQCRSPNPRHPERRRKGIHRPGVSIAAPSETVRPESPHAHFARGLYKLMVDRKWTQADFAREAGVSDDAISRYVRGNTGVSLVNAEKMAAALGMSVDEMMTACTAAGEPHQFLEAKAAAAPAGQVRLQVDQYVPYALAVKILTLLQRRHMAGR